MIWPARPVRSPKKLPIPISSRGELDGIIRSDNCPTGGAEAGTRRSQQVPAIATRRTVLGQSVVINREVVGFLIACQILKLLACAIRHGFLRISNPGTGTLAIILYCGDCLRQVGRDPCPFLFVEHWHFAFAPPTVIAAHKGGLVCFKHLVGDSGVHSRSLSHAGNDSSNV